MDKTDKKYTAIKLKGFDYYIWFETEKIINDLGLIMANNGWGKGGARTDIKCYEREAEAFIYSDELQYA